MRATTMPRLLLMTVLLLPTPLLAQLRFQEGRNYSIVPVVQVSGTAPAGKIEVAEAFSYLCSHCFEALPLAEQIKAGLPADAAFTYVHATLGHKEWQLMQRAHVTAQQLGIADRNHARMFKAIWETAEFPFFDPATGKPRKTPPVIRDAAHFYAAGGGVSEDDFVKKANSPEVQAAIDRNEELVKGWQIPGTPAFVVAGRYLVNHTSVSNIEDLRALISYLVGLERERLKKTPAAKKG